MHFNYSTASLHLIAPDLIFHWSELFCVRVRMRIACNKAHSNIPTNGFNLLNLA